MLSRTLHRPRERLVIMTAMFPSTAVPHTSWTDSPPRARRPLLTGETATGRENRGSLRQADGDGTRPAAVGLPVTSGLT